jgi:hypothetical protein
MLMGHVVIITCMNDVLNAPTRHDLIKELIVNMENKKATVNINKINKRSRQVKVLDISHVSRHYPSSYLLFIT